MVTMSDVVEWAKGSDRGSSECQGFIANDMCAHFGSFRHGYNSALEAAHASQLQPTYPGEPSFAYWQGTSGELLQYGHVGFGTPDEIVMASSRITRPLNALGTVGTCSVEHYTYSGGVRFLGWARTNGVNTMPSLTPRRPNQRTTASWPVGFRAYADLDSAHIARELPPYTRVDGIWWQYGDGGGSGEDRFLLVAHGGEQGYVHIGDVLESGTDGIPEYEGQRPKTRLTAEQGHQLAGWIGQPYGDRQYWSDVQAIARDRGWYPEPYQIDGIPGAQTFVVEEQLWEAEFNAPQPTPDSELATPEPETPVDEPSTPAEPETPEQPTDPTEEAPVPIITPPPISKPAAAKLQSSLAAAVETIPQAPVDDGALGAIVTDTKKRMQIYAQYSIGAMVLDAIRAGALAALATGFAIWMGMAVVPAETIREALAAWVAPAVATGAVFSFVSGAWASLGKQVAILARANPTKNS